MKIKPNMTTSDVICEMSEGNPGAMQACVELWSREPFGLITVRALDFLKVYGSRFYMLWNDVCDRDPQKMEYVVQAVTMNLGGITEEQLNHAIDNRGEGLDVEAVLAAVEKHKAEIVKEMFPPDDENPSLESTLPSEDLPSSL